jgi:succinate dehydrogenase / fumarate reductase iron-sulfur subunit
MCSLYINGETRGPDRGVTTCQLHAYVKDGDTITIEPFISSGKDLVVNRSAFDRIQHAGGFISVNTSGNTIDANSILLQKMLTKHLMLLYWLWCLCGGKTLISNVIRCCKRGLNMHYYRIKTTDRVLNMVQMDAEGFGNCTNTACVECPKRFL